jgi:hypothetical protein
MLRVIETEDRNQQWLGVADIMRAEAEEIANAALDRASGRANGIAAITPERVIREGNPTNRFSMSSTRTSTLRCSFWPPAPAPKARADHHHAGETAGTFPIPSQWCPAISMTSIWMRCRKQPSRPARAYESSLEHDDDDGNLRSCG